MHIVDGRVFDGLLNEIFSNEGVGSLVYGNDYQQIRKATRRDARLLYNLTRNAVKREELIHRTQQAIEKNIDQFFLFEVDEAIIACVTLMFYADQPETAELGSLYVLPFYHNRGIGKKMVEYACLQAKERGRKARDRALDAELRVLQQRVRLRGEHEGDPAGGPAEAIRGQRPQCARAREKYCVTLFGQAASMDSSIIHHP